MKIVAVQKYLGNYLYMDGSHAETIKSIINRAIGYRESIMIKLSEMCVGQHYFEAAMILCNSIYVSSILYAAEALVNINDDDTKKLEAFDEDLLRSILGTGIKTLKVLLHAELEIVPLNFIIMARRAK